MQFKSNLKKTLGKNNYFGTSDFEYSLSDDGFLVIEDLDLGNTSVTNDMHNVLETLVHNGHNLHKLKVIYRDSCNIYDAVLINPDNTLLAIASLNEKTLRKAYETYNLKIENQWVKQVSTPSNPC